jgi:hypothetical protein
MPEKQESKWYLEELADVEISAFIRYLDPDSPPETNGENKSALFVICVSLLVLLLGCIALIWLYFRVRA